MAGMAVAARTPDTRGQCCRCPGVQPPAALVVAWSPGSVSILWPPIRLSITASVMSGKGKEF